MNTGTKCSNHGFNLSISVNFIKSCFLYIQNLSTKWKNCLGCTASCSLCGTAGGISLDDEISQFSVSLSEQSANFPGSEVPSNAVFLLVKSLAFLAASLARCARSDFHKWSLQPEDSALKVCKLLTYYAVYGSSCFTVTKLLLGLSLKLRLFNLNTYNSS